MIPDDFYETEVLSEEAATQIIKMFKDRELTPTQGIAALSTVLLYSLERFYEIESGMKVIHHITTCYLKYAESVKNVEQ